MNSIIEGTGAEAERPLGVALRRALREDDRTRPDRRYFPSSVMLFSATSSAGGDISVCATVQ